MTPLEFRIADLRVQLTSLQMANKEGVRKVSKVHPEFSTPIDYANMQREVVNMATKQYEFCEAMLEFLDLMQPDEANAVRWVDDERDNS